LWHQGNDGPASTLEADDRFGQSLAAANFGRAAQRDLAGGSPGEDISGNTNAGAVIVLYGSAPGLTATGSDFWHQDAAGVPGAAQPGDGFGWSVSGGNYGDTNHVDLAIGVPFENNTATDDGVAIAMYGNPTGLGGTGDQLAMP
jgi:hypothetical protein